MELGTLGSEAAIVDKMDQLMNDKSSKLGEFGLEVIKNCVTWWPSK